MARFEQQAGVHVHQYGHLYHIYARHCLARGPLFLSYYHPILTTILHSIPSCIHIVLLSSLHNMYLLLLSIAIEGGGQRVL